jgi:hypothetical protein
MEHVANVIVVHGRPIDLDAVYEQMRAEAHHSADGRLIHARGLKYLLAEMYGLHADAGVPAQPLFDMRRETAAALRQLGWVTTVRRNSGRYELIRGSLRAPRAAATKRPSPNASPARPTPPAPPARLSGRSSSGPLATSFLDLAGTLGLHVDHGVTRTGHRRIGLYSQETPPVYRYLFAQWWSARTMSELVAWVLLNPGVGDTERTPRSILGRCRNLTQSWGFGGLAIVNLFAFRAREPNAVLAADDAIGPANDAVLATVTAACGRTIAAWGDGGRHAARAQQVQPILSDPLCLTKNGKHLTDRGQPFYPKAIAGSTRLVPLPPTARA